MSFVRSLLHWFLVAVGATSMTFGSFMVLPLMQTIAKPPEDMVALSSFDSSELPPPPPMIEEEPEPEPEEEPEPPDLSEDVQPLDLSQLELALNPGLGEGFGSGSFGVELNVAGVGGGEDGDELFSLSDLDQAPRVIDQVPPARSAQVRRKSPGTVKVIFIVNERGRVEKPLVQSSSDPVFERPALAAVKQWKFEPGKRNGKPVSTRMRVPITFPKD